MEDMFVWCLVVSCFVESGQRCITLDVAKTFKRQTDNVDIYRYIVYAKYDVSELPRRKFSLASGSRTRARRVPLRVFAAGNLLHGVQFFRSNCRGWPAFDRRWEIRFSPSF
jgi:hypothetical protein